jgi:2'-phosphotransferase
MKPNPARASDAGPGSTDPSDWLIRANQGHSIKLESEALHTAITLEAGNIPDIIVHGTYFAFWPSIVAAGGLKRMNRTHVHFGTGLPEDGKEAVHSAGDEEQAATATATATATPRVISGMRSDAELLIFVDVAESLRQGDMRWWLSENGVVLTEGNAEGLVPLGYFKEVRGRRQGVGLLWADGGKVADLPEGIAIRTPQGKRGRGGGRRGVRGGGNAAERRAREDPKGEGGATESMGPQEP